MKNDGYTHVSHKVSADEIGLGWLTGITEWMTPKATHVHPHKHSHIELIFCLKGTMTYKISGHGSVTIREGSGRACAKRRRCVFGKTKVAALRLPDYRNALGGFDLGVDISVRTLFVANAHDALHRR